MNGWFPKIRADGIIASGNSGIWLTSLNGSSKQVSSIGIGPIWAGQTIIFNQNDNTHTQYGGLTKDSQWYNKPIIPAYSDYFGSDDGQWTGFLATGVSQSDFYNGRDKVVSVEYACTPRVVGSKYGYLTPYLPAQRTLVVDGLIKTSGLIINWVSDRSSYSYVYLKSTGTYTKRIYSQFDDDVTIRSQQDEAPIVCFLGPDDYPWILSTTTNSGTFVRMIYSAYGYRIEGDLYYPDARIIGDRLLVAGSDSHGNPRIEWIDFTTPKIDLRLV